MALRWAAFPPGMAVFLWKKQGPEDLPALSFLDAAKADKID